MTDPDQPTIDDPRFQSLLVSCLEKLEQGEELDADALKADHPEFADVIEEFLADREQLVEMASALRSGFDGVSSDPDAPTITPNPRATPFSPGTRLRYFGDYELLEEIARGGMGVVYKARQGKLRRIVALKMILAGRLAGEQDVQRFEREARAAAKLSHPNIVAVHEVGEHEGQHFFSMDFVEGPSLAEAIRDEPLAAREAAKMLKSVAEAIHTAHEQGTLHRDLKPGNVLLDAEGQPHVTDFGLAKVLEGEEDSNLTTSGQILGTPSYMAPEQAEGKHDLVGPAADVYSLGAILYACLTGRPPFVAESPMDTLMQVVRDEPVPPRLLNSKIPRDLETICLKCLEKRPHERYGTAELLADDLGRFLNDEPITARPVGRVERGWRWCRRNPAVASLLALVALLMVTGTAVSTYYAVAEHDQRLAADRARETAEAAEGRALDALDEKADALREAKAQRDRADDNAKVAGQLAEEKSALAEKERDAKEEQERLRDVAEGERDAARTSLYLADIRRARQEIAKGELGEGGRILREHIPRPDQPDLRGWEWYWLLSQSEREVSKTSNLASGIRLAVWSPDGEWLATAGDPGSKVVRVYSADGLTPHRTWMTDARVTNLSWGPKAEQIALSLSSGKTGIWEVETSRLGMTVTGNKCVWSPDGKKLACRTTDTTAVVYDAEDGNVLREFRVPIDQPNGSLAWNPDSRRLVAMDAWRGTVVDTETGAAVANVKYPRAGGFKVGGVAWNPSGTELAFGYGYGVFYVCVWNIEDGKTRWYEGHFDHVRDVAWSADGMRLASASKDRRIQIRDSRTGDVLRTLAGHSSHIRNLAWHPDGDVMISTSSEDRVGVWRLDDRPAVSEQFSGEDEITNLSWNATGDRLLSAEPGAARIWDPLTGEQLRTLKRRSGGLDDVAWSPKGDVFATSDQSEQRGWEDVQIWDASGATPKFVLPTGRRIWSIDWSPDGRYVAAGGAYHDVCIFEASTGKLVWRVPIKHPGGHLVDVRWSPDGKWLVFCEERQRTALWSFETREKIRDFQYVDNSWSASWSPDGRWVALASKSGSVNIMDPRTGRRTLDLQGHRGWVRDVAWSPDGRRVASAANDHSVRVWDAESGEEILNLQGHESPAVSVAWSPDNERLASGDENGVIRIWDARPGYASVRGRVIPWWVVGPYPAGDQVQPPQSAIDPTAPVDHPDGEPLRWRRITADFKSKIDFSKVFDSAREGEDEEPGERTAYAQTFLYSSAERNVTLWLGHDATAQVWLNEDEVYWYRGVDRAHADAHQLPLRLRAGWNRLLVRVSSRTRDFSLVARVDPSRGEQIAGGVRFAHHPNTEEILAIDLPSSELVLRLKDLSSRLESDPENLDLLVEQITLLQKMSRWPEDVPDVLALLNDGEVAGAVSIAQSALGVQARPWDSNVWTKLGVALNGAGEYESAIGVLRRAGELAKEGGHEQHPHLAVSLWEIGQHEAARGHYAEYVAWFQTRASNLEPAVRKEAERLLSEVETVMGLSAEEREATVLEYYAMRIERNPEDLEARRIRGRLHFAKQDWAKAVADLSVAVRLDPNDLDTTYALSNAHHRRGEHDDVIAVANAALGRHPDWMLLWVRRGEAYRVKGLHRRAIVDLDRAVRLAPENDWVRGIRARTRLEMNDWTAATVDIEKAHRLGAESQTRLVYEEVLGEEPMEKELGDYRELCQALLDEWKKERNETSQRGLVAYCVCGPDAVADFAEIVTLARELRERNPDDPEARHLLGAALHRSGRYAEAVEEFRVELERDPDSVRGWLWLAMALARAGNGEAAAPWSEKAFRWLDENAASAPWNVRAEYKTLRREALQVLDGPPVPEPTNLVPEGLVLHLRFDEKDGGRVKDSVSGRRVGETRNVDRGDGVVGNALRVDGTTPVDVGRVFTPRKNEPFSVSAWAHGEGTGKFPKLMGQMSDGRGVEFRVERGKIVFRMRDGEHYYGVLDDNGLANEWTHVVGTYDGSGLAGGIRVYVNGELAGTGIRLYAKEPDSDEQRIAGEIHAETSLRIGTGFKGSIDEVRIYKRALKPAEVELLAAEDGDAPRLQGTWKVAEWIDGGEEIGEERRSKASLRFHGEKVTWTAPPPDGAVDLGPRISVYEIDSSTKPKEIDLFNLGDEDRKEPSRGIYELDGDRLRLVVSGPPPGSPRPERFESRSPFDGDETRPAWTLIELRRTPKDEETP